MLFYTLVVLLLFQLTFVDSSWWYMKNFNKDSMVNPKLLCKALPINRQQQKMCKRRSELILSIGESTRRTISECQYQFRSEKWNCSVFERDSSVFGKYFVKGGTRELSFVQAMASSSAVYTLSKACLSGGLTCGCNHVRQSVLQKRVSTKEDFKWQGCAGSGVDFSLHFVRRFTEAEEKDRRDTKARTTRHNNRVGRQTFLHHSYFVCKCHGVSGSCTMRTCWRLLPNLRDIGDDLKNKYDAAVKVTLNPSSRLVPTDPRQKKPNKLDLVYYEDSPDHCSTDTAKGLIGTGNRVCNETSEGVDSCDILCCGRGFISDRIHVNSTCECTFHWCCEVKCKICHEWKAEARCKSDSAFTSGPPRNGKNVGKFDHHHFPWMNRQHSNNIRGRERIPFYGKYTFIKNPVFPGSPEPNSPTNRY